MKKNDIVMPPDIRFMSDASTFLYKQLPEQGKYILDKTLTGCGGTEFFINSGRPLVLISPRTGVLLNKSSQHPECHLFRDLSNTPLDKLKDNLRVYLDQHNNPFLPTPSPVIFVTLDSAKYVIEELKHRSIIDGFLFLTDEFHCLIGDAPFKGKVDMEFLRMLDREALNICYMSATPISDTYLDALPEFQNVEYYKLQWDPNVIVEPTVKEVMMKKGESPVSIFSRIIDDYRRVGYFAKKIVDNKEVMAKEAVVFVNEVKTIKEIIVKNKLSPSEVTILISASNKYVADLERKGYMVEAQEPDRTNPQNTTFTFCSKASFEGRDFYSTSAFTYIFVDGSKEWEILDTTKEIPQIMGRQRLDENPFKYNAIIYYRTKPTDASYSDIMNKIEDKLKQSSTLVDAYTSGNDMLKKSLSGLVKTKDPKNPYTENYLDLVDDVNGNYEIEINFLVAASEHNMGSTKLTTYSSSKYLVSAIRSQNAIYNTKSVVLREFEGRYNETMDFYSRMKLYCDFMTAHPEHGKDLLGNPFIDYAVHMYYHTLGPEAISRLNYNEPALEGECQKKLIIECCGNVFRKGTYYTLPDVKNKLQQIYDELQVMVKAKAVQIEDYLDVELIQRTSTDGSRPRVYLIK